MFNNLTRFPVILLLFIIPVLILVKGSGTCHEGNEDFDFFNPDSRYKPATDFSFIKRFICISDLLGEEQWTKNRDRSMDSTGVHLTKGAKHPVNICHYALFCYDAYFATGEQRFKESFIVNARALIDENFYHRTDKDKIAYPYMIKFHDLSPPWYSALAQSEAISVLIRYYAMTNDKSVLKYIIELKNFMVNDQDDENCGTKSITPEGRVWYEEYPNSKQERQVINGFLLSIVALYEFSHLFPNDEQSLNEYTEAIETVKQSFKFYDTGSWLKYNRGDQRLVHNGYMKWQVLEFKFLYQLTGDAYFKKLMCLIATYCYNKEYDSPGSLLRNYDFSVPVSDKGDGKFAFLGKSVPVDIKKDKPVVKSSCDSVKNEYMRMYDGNNYNFFELCKNEKDALKENYLEFAFNRSYELGSVKIMFHAQDKRDSVRINFSYLNTENGTKFKKLTPDSVSFSHKENNYYFKHVNATSMRMDFEPPNVTNPRNRRIAEVIFSEPPQMVESDFWHYTSQPLKSEPGKMKFSFKTYKLADPVIFYRKSTSSSAIVKSLYNPLKAVEGTELVIEDDQPGFYQFLLVFPAGKEQSYLSDVSFIHIEEQD